MCHTKSTRASMQLLPSHRVTLRHRQLRLGYSLKHTTALGLRTKLTPLYRSARQCTVCSVADKIRSGGSPRLSSFNKGSSSSSSSGSGSKSGTSTSSSSRGSKSSSKRDNSSSTKDGHSRGGKGRSARSQASYASNKGRRGGNAAKEGSIKPDRAMKPGRSKPSSKQQDNGASDARHQKATAAAR